MQVVVPLLLLLVGLVAFLAGPAEALVKSIHAPNAPDSLTAKYYLNEYQHAAGQTPSCIGSHHGGGFALGNASLHVLDSNLLDGITFCVYDAEYPFVQIEHAIKYHYHAVASIYKDVLLNTDLSVDGLATIEQEHSYLCPSHVEYARPLRALNTHGKWRIIVNEIPASYDKLTQTVRIEKCRYHEAPCPKIPECYASKCVQKYNYHRLLVYNPKDYYYPFKVESFKLPSSCDCVTGPSYWTKDGDVADLYDIYNHPKHLLTYQTKVPILHDQPLHPVTRLHDKPQHPVEGRQAVHKPRKDLVSKSVHQKLSYYHDQTPKPQLRELHLPNHFTDHVTHVTPHYVDKSHG